MAENKNLNELNMLQNDGKVDSTQANKEDRKDVEAVARGKKTIEDVPQAVTVDLLKEYSNQNKIFAKLETHCNQDGVDIYAYFMRCFNDNETVKVSDILDDIAKRIPTLIDVINDDKNNNLVIDGNGNIDVAGALKKARDNGRVIPSYIQAIAQDAGKEVNEKKVIENYPLTQERKEEYVQLKKDISEVLKNSRSNPDYDNLAQQIKDMESGKNIDKKVPKDLYFVKKMLDDIDRFLEGFEVPNDIVGERVLFIKSYARLKQLQGIDTTNLPSYLIENINSRIGLMQNTIIQTHVVNKIEDTTPEKLESILGQRVSITDENGKTTEKSLREIYDNEIKSLKKIEIEAEKSYESIQLTEHEFKKNINQKYETMMSNVDFKNSANFLRIIYYMPKLKSDENVALTDDKVDKDIAKFFRNDPEKIRLLEESRKSFVRDDTNIIKIRTLKRMCFEDFFDGYEKAKEEHLNSLKPEKREKAAKARDCALIRYAVSFAVGDREKNIHTEADNQMQIRSKGILRKLLPEAFDKDGNIDQYKLFDCFKEKYSEFPVVAKLSSSEEMIKDSNIRTMEILKSKITTELIGANKSGTLGKRKVSEIANSREFIEEVSLKCNINRDIEFEHKFKKSIVERLTDRLREVNNKVDDSAVVYDLVRHAALTLTWRDMKGGSLDTPMVDMAKQVIAERIPTALTNGEIDPEKLKIEYKKYVEQKRKELYLDPIDYGDNPLEEEFDYFEKLQREQFNKEKLKLSSEEWKRHNEEIKEHANKCRKIVKGQEEQAVYEFISIVTKGRAGRNVDVLQTETTNKFSELSKRVDKRLQNRIGNNDDYKAYTEYVNQKEFDLQDYKAFAREAKLTFVRADANDLIEIIATKKDNINNVSKEDAMKKVFDYYIGIKRDIEERPVTDNDNTHKVRRLNYLMKKIAPEVFENDKVNEEKLLVKYNELFETNIQNVDDMFQIVEDKLLGQYAGKLVEALDKGQGYNNQYADPLVGRNFFRRLNEEKNRTESKKTLKISDKEMQGVMERSAEEMIVDSTVLQKQEDKNKVEGKDAIDSQVIASEDIAAVFEANAVELGGEEPKKIETEHKVEQHVEENSNSMQVENMEVFSDDYGKNLPVYQPEKGFFANIFDNIKTSIKNGFKNVKEKIFGAKDNNSGTGNTDNNSGTTSGTGGVSKTEQDKVTNLTGYGKFNLTFNNQAPGISEETKKEKGGESTEIVEPEGEEK